MSKLKTLTQIVEQHTLEIASSDENWMEFLRTAAYNYKYSFQDQVLIHEQRPSATMLADMDVWNNRMHRWIKQGAKSISLIGENQQGRFVRYVFDVTDTTDRVGSVLKQWELNPLHTPQIIKSLNRDFGVDIQNEYDLHKAIFDVAERIVDANLENYTAYFLSRREESSFENVSDQLAAEVFRRALVGSVQYLMLYRCGMPDPKILEVKENDPILMFNTVNSIFSLGNAVSKISEIGLRSIERTEKTLQNDEKKSNRTFANAQRTEYNEHEVKNEGSNQHVRNGVQEDRGLLLSGRLFGAGSETGSLSSAGQVRSVAPDVPERTPLGTVQRDDHEERDHGAPASGGRGSQRNGRSPRRGDGSGRRLDGGTESTGSDGVGAVKVQPVPSGGGDRDAADRLRITPSTEAEQVQTITEAEAEKSSAFIISQDDVDIVLGVGGSGFSGGKFRIYEQFLKDEGKAQNVAMLKKEYGVGGRYPVFSSTDREICEDHDGKGLHITVKIGDVRKKRSIRWEMVAKRIGELIAADRYLSDAEKAEYPNYLERKERREERNGIDKEFMRIVRIYAENYYQQNPDQYIRIDRYHAMMVANAFSSDDEFILDQTGMKVSPIQAMKAFMQIIADSAEPLRDQALSVSTMLDEYAAKVGKSQEELENVQRTYKVSPNDTVYIGMKAYTVVSVNEKTVTLSERDFPLMIIEMNVDEFQKRLIENRRNDQFLVEKSDTVSVSYFPYTSYHEAFFMDDETATVDWLYYNPDASSGGQFVQNRVSYDQIRDAAEETQTADAFFDYLEGVAVQTLIDVNTEGFNEAAERFQGSPDETDLTEQTRDALLERIRQYELQVASAAEEKPVAENPAAPLSAPFINEYNEIKEAYPDSLVLFQVGNFFESYGEDARTMASEFYLVLSQRSIGGGLRIDMCGFPKNTLSIYTKWLLERGIDVVVAAEENGERKITPFKSDKQQEKKNDQQNADVIPADESIKVPDHVEMSIEYSEHPALYDETKYQNISFALGNAILTALDAKQHIERMDESNHVGWYKKTGFTVKGTVQGEEFKYEGRYDIGDGESLIDHIRSFVSEHTSGKNDSIMRNLAESEAEFNEMKAGWLKVEEVLIPWLETHTELSPKEQAVYDDLMSGADLWFTPNRNDLQVVSDPEIAYDSDHIYLDKDNETLTWIYFADNPSTEGHFVECSVSFDQFLDFYNTYRDRPKELLDALNEAADTVLAVKTVPSLYSEVEAEYAQTPDYKDFTEENIRAINDFIISYRTNRDAERVIDRHEPVVVEKPHILLPHSEAERINYSISDMELGSGTPGDRYRNNIAAIRLLKALETEHRLATAEEQSILAKYVGWGGLADSFNESSKHYGELKSLLSEEEYAAARESSLTAFYTPPVVIKAMYQTLRNLGFETGNILEPSCGVGHFMGMLPTEMKGSKIYGIELDSISGKIAQQLYQRNSIAVQGYETTQIPDSFYDVAIGNVPFGQFKVNDRRYNKHNFLIHDYFFAKTLDKVRPGGIIAFITSMGTLDKTNGSVRKNIAQRAALLGAIRLPNNTFKSAAGTDVTSDIIFLQKRDRLIDADEPWMSLGRNEDGISMNQFFVEHPEMILGEMRMISGQFGEEAACIDTGDQPLADKLAEAIRNISGEIEWDEINEDTGEILPSIEADPSVRNFSYTVYDGKIYFRENSRMFERDLSELDRSRVLDLIKIRDAVRSLLEMQTENYPDEPIKAMQEQLSLLYDQYIKQHGYLNQQKTSKVFSIDSSYPLLTSLERFDENGQYIGKADIFTKRTVRQRVEITSVETAAEALALSLAERACVDMDYMTGLTGKTEEDIVADLRGVIFLNPQHMSDRDHQHPRYLPADEYLSGNVREKLAIAKRTAELYPVDYAPNVEFLESVQPKDLTAAEISVRLGATWIPIEDYSSFMRDVLNLRGWQLDSHSIEFSPYTCTWHIDAKTRVYGNVKIDNVFGTTRMNGLEIFETSLNLRDAKVYDYVYDGDKKRAVLNKQETALAQAKQESLRQAFADWIWSDPERRERLCKLYNERFNAIRPREFDGSHLSFPGMNPEITLRQHQKNGVAHALYGGNTLLAHVVGAGKTYTMIAIAQEAKRLGLSHKPMFVVPNHLVQQWASDYLSLYPGANILVARVSDFERKKRRQFCARIATGEWDAIIIGHSQLEKIPISTARQTRLLQNEIAEIVSKIEEIKYRRGERFTIKQLEKMKKSLQTRLDRLNDTSRKDDVVTFEELGVDRLFIDESHYFKNLMAVTKMTNVAGIAQTEAMRASDLYLKCRYLDEITENKGIVFATGTPISNSMVEMFTVQRYLQYAELKKNGLLFFDAWASTFGQTITAVELNPEGTGYRAKTRFSKFYNLPELMSIFKQTADIQTADMLKLPVPEAHFHNVVLKPSDFQREMVEGLSERAEAVRSRLVSSDQDNMLCITNDGRKLALDQRLMNPLLPENPDGKVAACANNVFEIWQRTAEKKSTQLVFCDLSTPRTDGVFDVYTDLKRKLMEMGVPADEIAFIHTAKNEREKDKLFAKVRSRLVRVLIGSTYKMGAGTNVQTLLCAVHHLDTPWRPADLEQRNGRCIRQGNTNKEVDIYTYVTESTFDSYLYQIVEGKQRFISQIMTSKSPVRSAEDVDEQALSYAEIKMLASGNPKIKEKMDLDITVTKLKLLKSNFLSQKFDLEDQIRTKIPQRIDQLTKKIERYDADIETAKSCTLIVEDGISPMEIGGIEFTTRKDAGEMILARCTEATCSESTPIGRYRGFGMELEFDIVKRVFFLNIIGESKYPVAIGDDPVGIIRRIDNAIDDLPQARERTISALEDAKRQLETAKVEVEKPFPQEQELADALARLAELNAELDLDVPDNAIVDDAPEDSGKNKSTSRETPR